MHIVCYVLAGAGSPNCGLVQLLEPMMSPKAKCSLQDVIRFIESRAPQSVSTFRRNPFAGRRFHYSHVRRAVEELHYRGRYRDLEPFDLKGTLGLWRGPSGVRYQLARQATLQLVRTIQDRRPELPLERILPCITHELFCQTPVSRYATTLWGMLINVYGGSPYRALKDLIDHDEDFAAYRDFQPSDMKKAPQRTWISQTGKKDYARARRLTRAFLQAICGGRPPVRIEATLAGIEMQEILKTPISRYGATLGGMIDQVYGNSPYLALKDLASADPGCRRYLPAIERRRYRHRRGSRPPTRRSKHSARTRSFAVCR